MPSSPWPHLAIPASSDGRQPHLPLPHHRGAAPRQPPLAVEGRRPEARRGGAQPRGAQGPGQHAAHGVAAGARDAQGFTLGSAA